MPEKCWESFKRFVALFEAIDNVRHGFVSMEAIMFPLLQTLCPLQKVVVINLWTQLSTISLTKTPPLYFFIKHVGKLNALITIFHLFQWTRELMWLGFLVILDQEIGLPTYIFKLFNFLFFIFNYYVVKATN